VKIPDVIKELINKDLLIFVATSDKEGSPHIAVAKGMSLVGSDRVAFGSWFCYQTLRNIFNNPTIALSFLRPNEEDGFQLIGTVENAFTTEVLNGYMPEDDPRDSIPHAKHQLQIRVEKILELSPGPHKDE
jgi:predicted pyridoxine 5'-phosphate oxidase superfamily flavin-nucleotide-binding protein